MPRRGPDGVLALLLTLGLAACSAGPPDPPSATVLRSEATPTQGGSGKTTPVGISVAEALERRAQAILRGDLAAFLAGLDPRATGFETAQQQYWDNLAQLPLTEVTLRPDLRTLRASGGRAEVVADLHLTMGGFDQRPALTRYALQFRRTPQGMRLTSATVVGGGQPWDLGEIVVRQAPGVLGVFDSASVASAEAVLGSFQRGIADVAPRVPRGWNGAVVVYAPSDLTFMASLDDVPGGDPSAIDALPVAIAGTRDGEPASQRIVLHPGLLSQPGPDVDRLIRHELTHVAVGSLGDRVPDWLSEGLAEYVSFQSVPPDRRGVTSEVVDLAETGQVRVPGSDGFDGNRSAAHYALAWWACETIARSRGESALWALLDAYEQGDSDPLHTVLGADRAQLERETARLLVEQYRPPASPQR